MRLIRLLFGVIVLLGLAVLALVLFLPGERLARIAESQIEAQTGRGVTLSGGVSLSFFPVLGVETGAVEMDNASWSDRGAMMRAEALRVGVDLVALIGGTVRVTGIEVVRPSILLERDGSGRGNWEFDTASAEGDTGDGGASSLSAVAIDRLEITGADLRFVDAGVERFRQTGLDAALRWPGGAAAADLSLSGQRNGARLQLEAELARPKALLAGGQSGVTVTAELAGASASFTGDVSLAPELRGQLRVTAGDPDGVMTALGFAAMGMPGGITLTSDLGYAAEGRISVRELDGTVFGTRLTGEGDLFLEKTPRIAARLSAGVVDLDSFTGSGGDLSESSATMGWSKAPFDASALGLVDGVVHYAISGLKSDRLTIGATEGRLTLDQARATVTLATRDAFSGEVSGQIIANARKGFSTRLVLNGVGIDLQQALAVAGVTRLSGLAEIKMDVLASGNSVHQLMNSAAGTASIATGQGRISGVDLDKLFRGAVEGGTTVFDALSASFTIDRGIAENSDLLMDLPVILAKGSGEIGLGPRNINYLFVPQLKADGGAAIPVRIAGDWSNVTFRPDFDAAAKARLAEEEQKLRTEAERRIKEELGVTEEGQSVEDALRKKLEDELKRRLGLPVTE